MGVDLRRTARRIEPKNAFHYFWLECGRTTTPDEQEFYGVWKPRRGAYWCEVCKHWHSKMKGVTSIACQGTEGKNSGNCTCGPDIPTVRDSAPNQPNNLNAVPMRVAAGNTKEPVSAQIPLPGMPGQRA